LREDFTLQQASAESAFCGRLGQLQKGLGVWVNSA
jgi:hypothetical protein